MNYTKGNWKHRKHADHEFTVYNADTGLNVAKINKWAAKSEGELEANAALIAAAPEMYEALKYVINWHREHDSGEGELFGLDFVTTCIAAVRKAEGK